MNEHERPRTGEVSSRDIERAGVWTPASFLSPVSRALRALQRYDELAPYSEVGLRYLIIEAQTALGEELGLTCTGEPDGWNPDGSVAYYSHNGETCPIHEWLVEADASEGLTPKAWRAATERDEQTRPGWIRAEAVRYDQGAADPRKEES
jgi:hypothetical protein